MNESAVKEGWNSRRLGVFSTLVLLVQLGLVYWLSDYRLPMARLPRPTPALQLAGDPSRELMALQNPVLFALPRKESFAGLAWMSAIDPGHPKVEWSESPRWLELAASSLGSVFNRFVETNVVRTWHAPALPEPALLLPEVPDDPSLLRRSSLIVISANPKTRLLNEPELPSWPPRAVGPTDFDTLTNSVVQAICGPDGKVISPTLLSGSGSIPADDYALTIARNLHFEPATGSTSTNLLEGLNWVRLIFEWSTLPGTNSPAIPPAT